MHQNKLIWYRGAHYLMSLIFLWVKVLRRYESQLQFFKQKDMVFYSYSDTNSETNIMTYYEGHLMTHKTNCKRKHIISNNYSSMLFTFSLLIQVLKMSNLNMDTQSKPFHSLKSKGLLQSGNFSPYTRTASLIIIQHSPSESFPLFLLSCITFWKTEH